MECFEDSPTHYYFKGEVSSYYCASSHLSRSPKYSRYKWLDDIATAAAATSSDSEIELHSYLNWRSTWTAKWVIARSSYRHIARSLCWSFRSRSSCS